MSSIEENGGNNMVMPVGPMYGGGNYGNGGFGMGNDSGWWVILLIILLVGRNGLGNNGGGVNMVGYDPSLGIQAGFNQAALTSSVGDLQSAVTNGFANTQQSLCNGFAGINSNIQNGFFQSEIAANNRQMADMQQNFSLQQQMSNCCCQNELAVANLRSDIAREACADRQAVSDALFSVTTQMNAGIQSLKDEFCQDRLDRKDEKIAELQALLNEQSRQASQNLQTQQLIANNEAQTAALEQYLAPVPRPAYIVQNPNCCASNVYGCCGGSVA